MSRRKHILGLLLLVSIHVPHVYAFDAMKKFVSKFLSFVDDDPALSESTLSGKPSAKDEKREETHSKKLTYEIPDNLSHSIISYVDNGIANAFSAAEEKAKADNRYPLLGHLIADNSKHFWGGLFSYGHLNEKFSERDLWWVVRLLASTDSAVQIKAQHLFAQYMLYAKADYKSAFLPHLNKVWIKKPNEGRVGSDTHSEAMNMFVALIEYGQINELKQIFEHMPIEIDHLLHSEACTQEEFVRKTGSFFNPNYEYEKKSYTLITWLLRTTPKATTPVLAKENKPASHLVEAAKLILEHIQHHKAPHRNANTDLQRLERLLKDEGHI